MTRKWAFVLLSFLISIAVRNTSWVLILCRITNSAIFRAELKILDSSGI
jgi:hypothetical protein